MARTCPNPSCGKSYDDDAAFCGECGSITIQVQTGREPDRRLGQRVGHYVVVAHVADGAMGRVYEGRHAETRARVAIKVLHPEIARDPVATERFKREYEAARDMDHPNIVKVIEFGLTSDGLNFMTMEFLEGEELGQLLRRHTDIAPARILRVMCQLGLALDYAHSFGFVHRDLKPDNIFLCTSATGDVVRVLDFGSVKFQIETGPKLTAFGTTLGSPYYMSPEQAMGKSDVDQRTDVFAMGAILYECLTGKVAFEGMNVAQILMKIISGQAIPASQVKSGLPPRIDDVLDRALQKDKTKRHGTGTELANDLCRCYGLAPDAAKWAETSEADIAKELEGATPPAARAYGAPPSNPAPPSSQPPRRSSLPPLPKSNGVMIGVAVGALALVTVLVLLFR